MTNHKYLICKSTIWEIFLNAYCNIQTIWQRFIPNNFLGTSENMLEKYVFLLVPTLLSLIPSEHDTCAVLLNEGRPNVQSRQEIIMKSTDSCYDVAMACMLARSKTMHASSILIRQQGLVFEPRDSKAITIHAHVLGEAVLLFL